MVKPKETYTLSKALKSAAMAGAVEAVRCRAEPGTWQVGGQKSKRVAIAAASGVAVGSLRNGRLQTSGKLPLAEAAMTGCVSRTLYPDAFHLSCPTNSTRSTF